MSDWPPRSKSDISTPSSLQLGRLRKSLRAPPSAWLTDLLYSDGIREASAAAWAGYRAMDCSDARIDDVSLRLGFSLLLYLDAKRPATELLTVAGVLTDGRSYTRPECEAFYLLLNEIDGGGPTVPSALPWATRLNALFAPHASFARQAEAELRSGWDAPK